MQTKTSDLAANPPVIVTAMRMQRVELDGEDVHALTEFIKHRDLFNELMSRGVFDTRAGSVTLHFDSSGVLRKIDTSHTTTLSTPATRQQDKPML